MKDKLPKVFANTIDKQMDNNDRVFYSKESEAIKEKPKRKDNTLTLDQKLRQIFGSTRYVYKADVDIVFKDGSTVSKKIIGRNRTEIITMDNEKINISDIVDVNFTE